MVKHIICFKIKDEKNCDKAVEILKSMKGKVPAAKYIDVRKDQLRSQRSYDIILYVDVESWDALDEYQKDEYHCEVVKKYIHSVVDNSIAIDYEY
jgi:hypothetical protein